MAVRMIITLDSGVWDGRPTWCTQVPKALGDSPRSGYPRRPWQGYIQPTDRRVVRHCFEAKKGNSDLNYVSNVKLLFFAKLHVHITIIISALQICYIMWLKCLSDSSSWGMRREWLWLWYQSDGVEACESISWVKHTNWLSTSHNYKGGVIEVILWVTWYYKVTQLGCAYYVNGFGC